MLNWWWAKKLSIFTQKNDNKIFSRYADISPSKFRISKKSIKLAKKRQQFSHPPADSYWQRLLSPLQKLLLAVTVSYPCLLNNSAFAHDLTVFRRIWKGTSVKTKQFNTWHLTRNSMTERKLLQPPVLNSQNGKCLCNLPVTSKHTHTRLMALFQDYLGEPVLER